MRTSKREGGSVRDEKKTITSSTYLRWCSQRQMTREMHSWGGRKRERERERVRDVFAVSKSKKSSPRHPTSYSMSSMQTQWSYFDRSKEERIACSPMDRHFCCFFLSLFLYIWCFKGKSPIEYLGHGTTSKARSNHISLSLLLLFFLVFFFFSVFNQKSGRASKRNRTKSHWTLSIRRLESFRLCKRSKVSVLLHRFTDSWRVAKKKKKEGGSFTAFWHLKHLCCFSMSRSLTKNKTITSQPASMQAFRRWDIELNEIGR